MSGTDIVPARAKDLSKEEYEEWVRSSFSDQQIIREGLQEARGGLWKAAAALYRFSETSGWLALGYDTVGEWLADPDITLARATYYRMVEAWRELHVIREVDVSTLRNLDLTKANITLPALKEGRATLEDVLADIETLGARDLREKYTMMFVPAMPEGWEPTGEGTDEEAPPASTEPPIVEASVADAESGVVVLTAAKMLLGVLLRVRREIGAEDRKAMSNALREAIDDVIGFAEDQGIADARYE